MIDFKTLLHRFRSQCHRLKIEYHHRRHDLDKNPRVVPGRLLNQTLLTLRTPSVSYAFDEDLSSEVVDAIEYPHLAATSTTNSESLIRSVDENDDEIIQHHEAQILEELLSMSGDHHSVHSADTTIIRKLCVCVCRENPQKENIEASASPVSNPPKPNNPISHFFSFVNARKTSGVAMPEGELEKGKCEQLPEHEKVQSKLKSKDPNKDKRRATRGSSVFDQKRKSSWQVVNNKVSLNAALISTGNPAPKLDSSANADFTNCKTEKPKNMNFKIGADWSFDNEDESPLRKKKVRPVTKVSVSPVYEDIYDITPTEPLKIISTLTSRGIDKVSLKEEQQSKEQIEKEIEEERAQEFGRSGFSIPRALRSDVEPDLELLNWDLKIVKQIREERLNVANDNRDENENKIDKETVDSSPLHGYLDVFSNYYEDESVLWRGGGVDGGVDGGILKESSLNELNARKTPALADLTSDMDHGAQLGFSPLSKAPATASLRLTNVVSDPYL